MPTQQNIRGPERIIEKAGEVDVTASAVIATIQAFAKINVTGEWIDQTETTSMNDLFDRMSTEEFEAYAQTGALPSWFRVTMGTVGQSRLCGSVLHHSFPGIGVSVESTS
jgi:hypothetical protein